jgi:hypothetical protein
MRFSPSFLRGGLEKFGQMGIEGFVELNVDGYSLAKEGQRANTLSAIINLMGNDHITGSEFLSQAADCADRNKILHPQLLESVDIGPHRDFMGQILVPYTMPR